MTSIFPPDFKLNVSDRSLQALITELHYNRQQKFDSTFEIELKNKIDSIIDQFMETVVGGLKRKNKFDPEKVRWYYKVYREGLEVCNVVRDQTGLHNPPMTTQEIEQFMERIETTSDVDLANDMAMFRTYYINKTSIIAMCFLMYSMNVIYEKVYNTSDMTEWFDKLNEYYKTREFSDFEKRWLIVKGRIESAIGLKL